MVAKAYTLTLKNVIGHCLLLETVTRSGGPYGGPLQAVDRGPRRASRTPRARPAGCAAPFGRPARGPPGTPGVCAPPRGFEIASTRGLLAPPLGAGARRR